MGTIRVRDIVRRVEAVEKRFDEIVLNQNKAKGDFKKNEKTDDNCVVVEMFFQRISVLERENKSLLDENKFLRMENNKLKIENTKKSNTAKFCIRNSQWNSKPRNSQTENLEPSCATQQATLNESAGYARGINAGIGQFQREILQREFQREEKSSKQQDLKTVKA